MSTLRISNIEAKSVPASATVDEKVKITNSSGDTLVFIDGKTSGITTVGINTTDGNITFDANSNVVVTGIITATKFSGQFEDVTSVGIADSIFHTGDTNTAIRFPAADTITAETSGSERLRIDSGGRLLVGTTSNSNAVRAVFQGYQGGGDNFQARVQFQTNQATNLASGSHLANLLFTNASGSVGAQIDVKADAAWGTNDYPARIEFKTTADGANTPTERLRITSDGNLKFGHTSSSLAVTNAHIKYISGGRDYWNGTKGDYRAIRFWVYDNAGSIDDVYGMGVSDSMLEIQAHGDMGFFTGSAGSGTGRRNHRATLEDGGLFDFKNGTKLGIQAANSFSGGTHALINLGSDQGTNTETRAIDMHGSWANGESKSITFTHAANASNIVGQINCVHNGPGSSLRWGKLYHGADSTAYTMTLDSVSTSGANLQLHDGNLILANGHGIDFSATANTSATGASASSELFDDYEEGSWTPTGFCDGGSLNVNEASYTKIGRVVYVYFYVDSMSIPNTACEFKIYGLPFTVAGTANNHYPPLSIGYAGSGNLPAEVRFLFRQSNTYIYSHTTASSGASLTNQGMRAYLLNQALLCSGFYFTNQ